MEITPNGTDKLGNIYNWTSPEVQKMGLVEGFGNIENSISNVVAIADHLIDGVEPARRENDGLDEVVSLIKARVDASRPA